MSKGLFLIALVVASQIIHIQTATLQNGAASIIRQLNDFEMSNDNGKQFIELLQLKLEQGSQVEEVLELIEQLLNQLKNDQQLDGLEHSRTMVQYASDILVLETNLEQMSQNLADTNLLIQVLDRDISTLEDTVSHLRVQLDVLNGKEEEIREARANDEISYNRRTEQSLRVSQALSTILATLGEAVLSEKDRQGVSLLESKRDSIVDKLKSSLGANHPITILVGVTMKFDIPVVVRIIEKLENILDAVNASKIDDDSNEAQSIVNFNTLIQEISDVREKLSDDLSHNLQILQRKNTSLVTATRTSVQLQEDIPLTQSILENTTNQSEQYHAAFQSRQSERAQEITIVQSAFDLINNQVQSVKKVEALQKQLDGQ